ncbi:MAG: ABC transporter permease [Anaerolineales bacterium]|nr:ABC transporter permease [Anaerolineales bacterium]
MGAQVYDSAARAKPALHEFLQLFRYRDLILELISRSIKTRYKRSLLGVAWTMVSPLLSMLVLTLVFSHLFRFQIEDYALYVLSGLLTWNFFAQSTTAALNDLIWSGGLINRIYFPASVFSAAAIGTGLVNLALALVPYMLITLILGAELHSTMLLLPIPVLGVGVFTLGVGLAVSSAAVRFQDVLPMYEVILGAWMYLTPVFYPIDAVPPQLVFLFRWNPMFYYVDIFRSLVYLGEIPSKLSMLSGTGFAMLSFLLGWFLFNRKAREYAAYL